MPAYIRFAAVAAITTALPHVAAARQTAAAQERYLFELLQAGGWAMVPLGLCLLGAIYLLVYCWRETAPGRFFPKTASTSPTSPAGAVPTASTTAPAGVISPINTVSSTAAISPDGSPTANVASHATNSHAHGTRAHALAKGNAWRGTNRSQTLFDTALARGLGKAVGKPTAAGRAAAETAIGETLTHAEAETLRWIGYLNIIAAIAPMIGLLGTVSGMIGAFGTISLGGMGRPELLAGNIGEALITTATGLAVGIPAMLCYHVLHNRLGLRMNETVSRLNDALDTHFDTPAGDTPTSPR